MADDDSTTPTTDEGSEAPRAAAPRRVSRRSASRPAGPPQAVEAADGGDLASRAVAQTDADGEPDVEELPSTPRRPLSTALLFQAPDPAEQPRRPRRSASRPAGAPVHVDAPAAEPAGTTAADTGPVAPAPVAVEPVADAPLADEPVTDAPRADDPVPVDAAPVDAAAAEDESPAPARRSSRGRSSRRSGAARASEGAVEGTPDPAAAAASTTAPSTPAAAGRAQPSGSRRLAPGSLAPVDDEPAAAAPADQAPAADTGAAGQAPRLPRPSTSPFAVDLGDELDRLRSRRSPADGAGDVPEDDTDTSDTDLAGTLDGIRVDDRAADDAEDTDDAAEEDDTDDGGAPGRRSRRRRGGRGRRRRAPGEDGPGEDGPGDDAADDGDDDAAAEDATGAAAETDDDGDDTELDADDVDSSGDTDEDASSGGSRRRRRRRGRSGGSSAAEPDDGGGGAGGTGDGGAAADTDEDAPDGDDEGPGSRRRRRGRSGSRGGSGGGAGSGAGTGDDSVTAIKGSTRLEAKRQRRRDGRDSGRRPKIISEAEFLARREAVARTMVVRSTAGRTQIAVLEDGVLVEHYVARKQHGSMIGNVYLGKVQNVLPSMEAAFVDVGRGRNAVLYAGEVNWEAAGLSGQAKRIETAMKSGDPVLVQVSKDPVGHKGARLTSQVSLPGRYLVYVPGGSMTGISRKLPDTERARLKKVLREVVPEDGGVIVRTAAEGASEDELRRDVERLVAQWEEIEARAAKVSAPVLLHGEPDLTIKVVRDVFNEDFTSLVVDGDDAWSAIKPYIDQIAPDLSDRVVRWESEHGADRDAFDRYRVDEQIAKALERKVWLPSGGSLVIDRTEAMTVVDVNTGRFTGSGGNLEETVTRNNLEAAEEIVRQLRLRDIGGIVVVDFIDMVLESNRDLVLRRLVECLGRDRTKHQVAEVTSLGLVQMTRKRVGQGLLESFSESCEHCHGRGVVLSAEPVDPSGRSEEPGGGSGGGGRDGGGRGRRGRGGGGEPRGSQAAAPVDVLERDAPEDEAERARLEAARDAVRDAIHGVALASRLVVPPTPSPGTGQDAVGEDAVGQEDAGGAEYVGAVEDAGPVDVGPVDVGPVDVTTAPDVPDAPVSELEAAETVAEVAAEVAGEVADEALEAAVAESVDARSGADVDDAPSPRDDAPPSA